jgi:hypothetical protein
MKPLTIVNGKHGTMSEESKHILHGIQIRLRTCWGRLTTERVAVGLILLITAITGTLLILLTVEMRLWLPTPWRGALFWVWVGIGIALLSWFVVRPWMTGWLGRTRYKTIAHTVTRNQPDLQSKLVSLLELCNGESSAAPRSLVDNAVKALNTEVSNLPLIEKVDWKQPIIWSRYAAIPLGLIAVLTLAAPQGFRDASIRLFSPRTTFERPAPFALTVTPGNIEVTRGDSLTIIATASGETLPEIVSFELGVPGESSLRSHSVRTNTSGRFLHREHNLRLPLRYRAVSGSVRSPWYAVTVIDRPILRDLQVTLRPPAYTGLPAEQLPPGTGNITALQGTIANIRVRSSDPDVIARLSMDDTDQDLVLDDMAGDITLHEETTYRIILQSPSGVQNLDPITYSITPLIDQYPFVELVSPAPQADMDFELLVPLDIRIRDDFGFSRLTLSWRLSDSRFGDTMETFQEITLSLPGTPEIQYLWDLGMTTGLDIVPGDVISYFVTVWDNDGYNGAKKSVSATQQLRLPSIAERYEALESTQDETESGLESLVEEAEYVREQFEELRDELREKQDADWDDQQSLESLRQAQEQLQNRADELANNMAEAAEQMADHNLVSDELLDIFEELQNVTEEINSPELAEALEQLQEALTEFDPAAMQESLEKFEFNEEMFRERIERTLELFKNFQVQQQLEETKRRAEDLQDVQDNLAEQTAEDTPTETPEALAEEQMQAAEEMSALEAKMEEIAERMRELQRAPVQEMEQLNEQTQANELPKGMRENAQQMQTGQMQQANQGQQQMSQSMQQLQSDLQNVQTGMQGQQMQINMAALRLILSNVLRLSYDQEDLRRNIAEATRDSPLLRDFAREQAVLATGGAVVADSIQSLGRTLPQLSRAVQEFAGNALMSMETSIEMLTESNNLAAESSAAEAMTNLNNLALLLSDLLDQLMDSSSSSSGGGMSMEQMIQQLQEMAMQQDQLNQALEDLFGQAPGERMSADMQERLRQLAGQQEAMRRQLTEMARERDLASQLAGDLERIAEQMAESIQELQTGQVNRPTRQRQQQILTRLLDASRSLQERGEEERREGRRSTDIERVSPGELQNNLTQDALRRALMDALESGYTKDYQALIQRYFELLRNQ